MADQPSENRAWGDACKFRGQQDAKGRCDAVPWFINIEALSKTGRSPHGPSQAGGRVETQIFLQGSVQAVKPVESHADIATDRIEESGYDGE